MFAKTKTTRLRQILHGQDKWWQGRTIKEIVYQVTGQDKLPLCLGPLPVGQRADLSRKRHVELVRQRQDLSCGFPCSLHKPSVGQSSILSWMSSVGQTGSLSCWVNEWLPHTRQDKDTDCLVEFLCNLLTAREDKPLVCLVELFRWFKWNVIINIK